MVIGAQISTKGYLQVNVNNLTIYFTLYMPLIWHKHKVYDKVILTPVVISSHPSRRNHSNHPQLDRYRN